MITKDNNLKVMELFFKSPYSSFHIREIARLTGLSSTGVIKIVKKLKKEKLIVSSRKANLVEVRPDFEGRFTFMKRIYNIFSLYDSGLIALLKNHYEQPAAIILFGSYADGSDTEKSDIDLAVTSKKNEAPDLEKFEKQLKRNINVQSVTIKTMSKEFKNSLANGIVLEGFAELIR